MGPLFLSDSRRCARLWRRWLKRPQHRSLQGWQIVLHRAPDCFEVDALILMAYPVAGSADLAPRRPRTNNWGLFAEADGRFADDQKIPLHRGNSFRVFAESSVIHASGEIAYRFDGVRNVAERLMGVPKRQERLPVRRGAAPRLSACAARTDPRAYRESRQGALRAPPYRTA